MAWRGVTAAAAAWLAAGAAQAQTTSPPRNHGHLAARSMPVSVA